MKSSGAGAGRVQRREEHRHGPDVVRWRHIIDLYIDIDISVSLCFCLKLSMCEMCCLQHIWRAGGVARISTQTSCTLIPDATNQGSFLNSSRARALPVQITERKTQVRAVTPHGSDISRKRKPFPVANPGDREEIRVD